MTSNWAHDQVEIRCLIENYSDAIMRRDTDAVMRLWAEDCHWGVPDMAGLESVRGKATIQQALDGAQALFPFIFLLCVPGEIAIDGDTATGRNYTTEILRGTEGDVRKAVGRYDDKFNKINGKWYFSERIWHMMFIE